MNVRLAAVASTLNPGFNQCARLMLPSVILPPQRDKYAVEKMSARCTRTDAQTDTEKCVTLDAAVLL